MRKFCIPALAVLLALLAAAPAAAGGAGGVLHGEQRFDPQFANFDLGTQYVGGYGYGVSASGQRMGGFGLAFFSEPDSGRFSGGVGGVMSGQEFRLGPFEVAANLWTGVGGVAKHTVLGQPDGWFVLFGQADVEVGLAILPWWQISSYAGVQLMANLAPGEPFEGLLVYTPVVGVRVAWGGF
jgi:hypothetical protein